MRAVVFDFDGVILDTETPEFVAWSEVFEQYGCELTLEEWATGIGTHGGFDPWATLVERASVRLPSEPNVQAGRRARQRELLEAVVPLPGVLDWLEEAATRQVPLAIASSSPPDWIEPFLDRFGIRQRFVCLACRNGTLPAKPDPAVYLHACESLGVDPADAIAVEDSPNGIAAAKAAGLYTVAVANQLTRSLDLSPADLVVDSLGDVPLGDVLSLP